MDQPILSFEETVALIQEDIDVMACAAQSFDDLAEQMHDGDEKRHLQFVASRCRECEQARRTLIKKMLRRMAAS